MDEKDKALHTLVAAGCYWTVNWRMVKAFGRIDEALVLAYLCSMQRIFGNQHGVFYRTVESMKNDTFLDVRRQRKAIKNLAELRLIETRVFGLPKKRYFRVLEWNVAEYLKELECSQQLEIDHKAKNDLFVESEIEPMMMDRCF